MTVKVGRKIPAFELPATGDQTISNEDLAGRAWVLYFYPRDNTPGCTTEGEDFRDNYAKFRRRKVTVLGVSRDSLRSHERFKAKYDFPFELLSDENEELCTIFDVIKQKNMYGKKVRGIERSTFLVDASGKLRREWRKVKIDGHVAEVLEAVKEL
ncbi:MAG: peroxiredoxin [Gammaproteobacteria bacterium]|jgi:peroxiredoxin Q/BCP